MWRNVLVIMVMLWVTDLDAETHVPRLSLYDGVTGEVFLGCLNCRASDPRSVWNRYGRFGNPASPDSIWNARGIYGAPVSPLSPWHPATAVGPMIRDLDGRDFGRFSRSAGEATTALFWLEWILVHHETVRADLPTYRRHFVGD
ncbi:MAG: hypothetical protein AAF513_02490 [Pseudomonadota bacterium]